MLELKYELMLLGVMRPAVLPGGPDETLPTPRAFGCADSVQMVGESPALWELRRAIAFFAPLDDLHVLIQGASGAGKGLVAHALHRLSPRRGRGLVSRSATTFTETLAEAELFGTAKDFPSMGVPERSGLWGEANHSTLFLDEIGDLPESVQVKLLRVVDQAGEFQRLGDTRLQRADIRLVAATHRAEVSLRHDMLARFKGRIVLPDTECATRRYSAPRTAPVRENAGIAGVCKMSPRAASRSPDDFARPSLQSYGIGAGPRVFWQSTARGSEDASALCAGAGALELGSDSSH